jgi:hypothetical protein
LYYEKEPENVICPKCNKVMFRIKPPMKLGEILVLLGLIDEEKIEKALNIQKKINYHYPIGKILVKLGLLTSNQLYRALIIQRKALLGTKL